MEHLAGTAFSRLDIKHKTDFEKFVRAEKNNQFRAFVVNLYDKWREYNISYFNDKLEIPTYITLGNTSAPNTFGEYASVSSWGGTSEIRIKPSLFQGKHPHIKKMLTLEGRHRFMFDVLLHEQVHQYQHEYLKASEDSYRGHGPVFRDECNRISELLGITQKVRTCKKRGKDKDLPSCAQWPHNVRPEDYYGPMVEEPEIVDPKGPVKPEAGLIIDYDYIKKLCEEFLTEDERDRLSAEICSHDGQKTLIHELKDNQDGDPFCYELNHFNVDEIKDKLYSIDILLDEITPSPYGYKWIKEYVIEGFQRSHDLALSIAKREINEDDRCSVHENVVNF